MENQDMDNEKTCSLCGEPLSRYGNKKILDGMLCRNCIKAASDWLSDEDFEKMSLEDYKAHLDYRKQNEEKVEAFESDKTIEGKYTLYLDEKKKEFVISKRKDYKKDNADVVSFDDIKEICVYEENYPDSEDVDICFEMKLNNKHIENIRFRVNEFPGLIKESDQHKETIELGLRYLSAFEEEEGIDFEEVKGE